MIALDSSALIAFLAGVTGRDTDLVDRLLADHQACLPPVVLTEMLSDPKLPKQVAELLVQIPRLELLPGYWERAGALRAKVLGQKRRARLADTLIAQSCIDHDVGLVTGMPTSGSSCAPAGCGSSGARIASRRLGGRHAHCPGVNAGWRVGIVGPAPSACTQAPESGSNVLRKWRRGELNTCEPLHAGAK